MKNPFKTITEIKKDEDIAKKPITQETSSNVTKKREKPTSNYSFKKPRKAKKVEKLEEEKIKDDNKKADISTYDSKNDYQDNFNIKKYIYKRLVDKKLTIILLEDTTDVAKINDMLKKIIKTSVISGLVTTISYGESVKKSEIIDISDLKDNDDYICKANVGDKTCLFDALIELEHIVSDKYSSIEENEKERIRINNIEIIGIGNCIDNCSKAAKKAGIDCFYKVASKPNIVTKYFCLTEESFLRAAEIGFHSIGAIFRNYQ